MKIMVCIDGPASAPELIRIAARFSGEIHLVQVLPHRFNRDGVAWSGSDAVDIEKHAEAVAEAAEARNKLEALVLDLPVNAVISVLTGPRVADELISYARAEAVDVIAIGSRMHGPLHGGVGGETTRRLLEANVAPVLLAQPSSTSHIKPQLIPVGCPVFSREGRLLGDVAEVTQERFRLTRHDHTDTWIPLSAVAELSVTSGLIVNAVPGGEEQLDQRPVTAGAGG